MCSTSLAAREEAEIVSFGFLFLWLDFDKVFFFSALGLPPGPSFAPCLLVKPLPIMSCWIELRLCLSVGP